MKVALFVTCVNDVLYPDTGRAVVTVLERLGVEVEYPAGQTCCGQPQYNTGYRHETEPLARRFGRVFDSYDYIVTPSGSCAAMARHHYPRLAERARDEDRADPALDHAAETARRTYEFTEFLTDVLGTTDVGAYFPHTVTYHPSCHGLRTLRLGDRPLRLLGAVEGIDLRELGHADECCGFGGTFAVKNPDVSTAMGRDKIGHARDTGAQVLCGADNSCLMHLGGLIRHNNDPLQPLHLADILAATRDRPHPLTAATAPAPKAAPSAGGSR